MMVTPQIFNLRPAVMLAAFFFLILSVLSISKYLKVKEHNRIFEQEKVLVLNELSEMIDSYDSVDVLNDSLIVQLKQSKEKMMVIRDSVKTLKPNQALIEKFKAQIKILKVENRNILSFVEGLGVRKRIFEN
ncbi:hypothetical protein N7U66_14145 [Lacinutrix neustonica]|uniref:Uncharacterized protein n=1 Tax=Lacinutrix neustonica TaxID=2980107 RepID=A0A9E8SDJ2_9FLAO|nr:hypothetical protein [Lacinutrix neustonica]WAC01249.1 hypothetical protein N7U66_14145 [Lacinutrix neustonica]